ncbi:uncharacterized protein LOC108624578 [Ceratina calcarata]|uniref:Uncharacterized protein LOC108624578 n=1 Tax=Ceratina calcarata TaxID=156304 RepID=A0AAJ7IY50_9HYME|nr:uncharacterized protein LOC108624578 [Ceratina calcarata]XP_017879474.1 uncharacterized protein LOC108624578 [Ceratina calcarata]XP_026669096.1 uncharacterized protein LOC108624578 [Ceratina calcarata]XP_026669105.1 uncharacterized protein LOC108624578 [Ceratina calcarata]XP_026669111.1 uncharacterized protein LOC108624578 [Ceratina calcarata]
MSSSIEPLPVQKLDSLLAQSLGNDFQIKHIEWRPLTAPGENFGSVMLAISVTLSWPATNKTETLNLVAKLPPTNAYLLDLFNSSVTFRKELRFYSSMAREYVNLQLESGINEEDLTILVPKFYSGRLGLKSNEFDEQATIILENLKSNGFETEDRIYGLDKKHTEYAIQKLAKLHALTIALKMKKPQMYEKIAAEVMMKVANETTIKCTGEMIYKTIQDIKGLQGIEPYLDRVTRTINCESLIETSNPEEPWGTLVHNDFWVNNMMFRHDNKGNIIDMKIVDFQLGDYDYGAKDLLFFLISSANKEIIDNKLDDMIDFYYSNFIEALKSLRVDTEKFSKQKFDEIVNKCGPLKFSQCIMMTQVIQAPRGITPEMKDLQDNNVFMDISSNEVYRNKLFHTITVFEKRGWLLK